MKVRSEATRVVKFSAVGLVAFVVDIAVFNLLRLEVTGMGPLWAKVIGVAVATAVAWVGSRYWTFRDGRQRSASREALGFFAVNAAGLVIAMACLWVSHYLLGMRSALADNISANIVGAGLGNIFRYLMYRLVIYRVRPSRRSTRRQVLEFED